MIPIDKNVNSLDSLSRHLIKRTLESKLFSITSLPSGLLHRYLRHKKRQCETRDERSFSGDYINLILFNFTFDFNCTTEVNNLCYSFVFMYSRSRRKTIYIYLYYLYLLIFSKRVSFLFYRLFTKVVKVHVTPFRMVRIISLLKIKTNYD